MQRKKGLIVLVSIIVVVILIGFGFYLYKTNIINNNINKFSGSLTLIQDNLTEATVAKIMGDSLIEKKKLITASWERVDIEAQMVSDRLKELKVPEALSDYQKTAIAWTDKILAGAKDHSLWKDIGDDPGDFQLTLSDKQVQQLFEASAKKIAELKEFGGNAIEMKNQISMIYIGAKLKVQSHWLNGIFHSAKKGLLSSNIIAPALAYGEKMREICAGSGGTSTGPITPGGKKGNVWCVNVIESTGELATTATTYDPNGPMAKEAEEWQRQWQEFLNRVPEGSKPAFEGVKGNPNPGAEEQISPIVQVFYDDCAVKGGTVGNASIPKSRLPTTEFGYTCEYKNKDNKACWDYLTYSGGWYMGGETGCEEENLLPNTAEEQANASAGAGGKWDGHYTGSVNLNCKSTVPGKPSMSQSFPMDFPVVNNVTYDQSVNTYVSIGDSGNATESFQTTVGGQNATVYIYALFQFHFTKQGDKAAFSTNGSMDMTVVREDGTFYGSCIGTGGGGMK